MASRAQMSQYYNRFSVVYWLIRGILGTLMFINLLPRHGAVHAVQFFSADDAHDENDETKLMVLVRAPSWAVPHVHSDLEKLR